MAAQAREQMPVSGPSSVLPRATIAAEAFGQNTSSKTPVVYGGGILAGSEIFATASRKINSSEANTCRKTDVAGIWHLHIGEDGDVFAAEVRGPAFALIPSDRYNTRAAKGLAGGKLVLNRCTKWTQIDAKQAEPHAPMAQRGGRGRIHGCALGILAPWAGFRGRVALAR